MRSALHTKPFLRTRVHAEHISGPEQAGFDHQAKPCICGAAPLLVETHSGFYLNCPPCWARTLTVFTASAARAQWNAMIYTIRRFT
jgi:hypothetical protein